MRPLHSFMFSLYFYYHFFLLSSGFSISLFPFGRAFRPNGSFTSFNLRERIDCNKTVYAHACVCVIIHKIDGIKYESRRRPGKKPSENHFVPFRLSNGISWELSKAREHRRTHQTDMCMCRNTYEWTARKRTKQIQQFLIRANWSSILFVRRKRYTRTFLARPNGEKFSVLYAPPFSFEVIYCLNTSACVTFRTFPLIFNRIAQQQQQRRRQTHIIDAWMRSKESRRIRATNRRSTVAAQLTTN